MLFLIDGYNLVKTIFKKAYVDEKELKFFIDIISQYTIISKNYVIIIFDGFSNISYKHNNFISIRYSENRSADDSIKDYLIENSSENIILITSDQELKKFAYKLEIDTLDSYSFYHRINKKINKKVDRKSNIEQKKRYSDQFYKLSQEQDSELDQLMINASKNIIYKDENIDFEKNQNKKSSKISKKIDKILKKI